MAELSLVSTAVCFGGKVQRWKHKSTCLGEDCNEMTFATFLPAGASAEAKVPVVYWLSGLTCTDQNFITKAAAQKMASELKIALVCPDTSPRGCGIEGEEDGWDFGTGAGFYVDATNDPWKKNYNMFSYVTKELPTLVESIDGIDTTNCSIMGHSMGGHGALICALKTSGVYKSVSAFAPICHPMDCPWGEKAFTGYMGDDKESWKAWDATELLKSADSSSSFEILVDQGTADNFYTGKQLLPESFEEASTESKAQVNLNMRYQEGYDHSYYFIQTFVNDHLQFHASFLNK